jgi:predicted GH43/DUF377 family glycosyl hydrolase
MHLILADDFKQLKDKLYWTNYLMNLRQYIMLEPEYGFEMRHLGAGAPPIKTKYGWLMIYHGTDESSEGRVYHAGAALFDKKNPQKLIARLPYPLFSPGEKYEKNGFVHDVVFPTGTAQFGDKLYIYYGAADTHIGAVSVSMSQLLAELRLNKVKPKKRSY